MIIYVCNKCKKDITGNYFGYNIDATLDKEDNEEDILNLYGHLCGDCMWNLNELLLQYGAK